MRLELQHLSLSHWHLGQRNYRLTHLPVLEIMGYTPAARQNTSYSIQAGPAKQIASQTARTIWAEIWHGKFGMGKPVAGE